VNGYEFGRVERLLKKHLRCEDYLRNSGKVHQECHDEIEMELRDATVKDNKLNMQQALHNIEKM
jgi:hypothetical protein